MIIPSVKVVRARDIQDYSWLRIKQFQNVDYVAATIEKLHSVPAKHRQHVRSQAEQLKYCLTQAREYFEAALSVSAATRPVLLYYSAMSMALAEVLLKQNGDSRLSKLRANHNCHGLFLTVSADPKSDEPLNDAARKLVAKPQLNAAGEPRGTFEVWRRSAREYPLGGYLDLYWANGTMQTGYSTILQAADAPPPRLPQLGVSLLECMVELPYMSEILSNLGHSLEMVRGNLRASQKGPADDRKITMTIHPNRQELIDRFGELVVVEPAAVNTLEIDELPSGYIVKSISNPDIPGITWWPHSVCLTDEDVYFSCSRTNLGEFGYLYVALHICGNFARYYPDLWLKHIEKNSPLSTAVDELCSNALDRLPLLCLSELVRSYHVLAK